MATQAFRFRRLLLLIPLLLSRAAPIAAASAPACNADATAQLARAALAKVTRGKPEPGVTLALYYPTRWSKPVAVASGYADYARKTSLKPDSPMLAGSVGKTFFAAAALHLAEQGKLDLDQPIGSILANIDIPNGTKVTTRMLLSHTSGYGEYDGAFMQDLIKQPLRARRLDDWIGSLRRNPPAAPGTFRYSDINYVLIAAVIDRLSGEAWSDYIERTFLRPFGLADTRAALSPRIVGLTPAYAGDNFFGRDAMMERGTLIYNPQFESGGGGYVSTAPDLSRWIVRLATANAYGPAIWRQAATPTHPADAKGNTYGLGIHIDRTSLGTAYGHSGYIPGYVSWVRYYDRAGIGIAIQTNTSDRARLTWDGYDVMDGLVAQVIARCVASEPAL